MSERTYSLPKITIETPLKRQGSMRYVDIRLNFPKPGDSSIYHNVGRKHFQSNSDRMLKIILPEKFPIERPLNIKREASVLQPRLIQQISDKIVQNHRTEMGDANVRKMFSKEISLRQKIEDELDKMQKSMQRQKKQLPTILTREDSQKRQVAQTKVKNQSSPKMSSYLTLTPQKTTKNVQPPIRNASQLLYNPQNKQKYDLVLKSRWMNPTNLSTGLSII